MDMCQDGTEKIKTFTSMGGLFAGAGNPGVYGGRELSAESGGVKIRMVFSVDAVLAVLFQFFLWTVDCVVLCIYLEGGASESQLESVDDDACADSGCVFGKIVSGAVVYGDLAGVDVGAFCGDRKDCRAYGDAACTDFPLDAQGEYRRYGDCGAAACAVDGDTEFCGADCAGADREYLGDAGE